MQRRGIDPESGTFTRQERAQLRKRSLTEREKLNLGISLNVWDAAKSYRLESGDTRPLRVVLHDPTFASAWRTFKGGAGGGVRWWDLTPAQRRDRMRRGFVPTSFDEKMEAAKVLGWHRDQKEGVEKLRNVSP